MNPEDECCARESDNIFADDSASPRKPASFFEERAPEVVEVAPQLLRHWSRRDVLLFGMGAIAAAAGGVSLLPQSTLKRLGIFAGSKNWPRKEWLLDRALRIDDDVAEALYSSNRMVPTYTKSQITPLRKSKSREPPVPENWRCLRLREGQQLTAQTPSS